MPLPSGRAGPRRPPAVVPRVDEVTSYSAATIGVVLAILVAGLALQPLRRNQRLRLPAGTLADVPALVQAEVGERSEFVAAAYIPNQDLVFRANRLGLSSAEYAELFRSGHAGSWRVLVDDGRRVEATQRTPRGELLPEGWRPRSAALRPNRLSIGRRGHAVWSLVGLGASAAAVLGGILHGLPLAGAAIAVSLGLVVAVAMLLGLPPAENGLAQPSANLGGGLRRAAFQLRREGYWQTVVNAVTVAVAVAVGAGLSERFGYHLPWSGPGELVAAAGIGASLALLVNAARVLLYRRGLIRMTPELHPDDLALTGYRLPPVLSLAVQASVGEESMYRLLVPAGALAVGLPFPVAVLSGIVIWVGTHPQGEVEPAVVRVLELLVVGIVLSALLWSLGLIAAIVTHLVFNLSVLTSPLLERRFGRVRSVTHGF